MTSVKNFFSSSTFSDAGADQFSSKPEEQQQIPFQNEARNGSENMNNRGSLFGDNDYSSGGLSYRHATSNNIKNINKPDPAFSTLNNCKSQPQNVELVVKPKPSSSTFVQQEALEVVENLKKKFALLGQADQMTLPSDKPVVQQTQQLPKDQHTFSSHQLATMKTVIYLGLSITTEEEATSACPLCALSEPLSHYHYLLSNRSIIQVAAMPKLVEAPGSTCSNCSRMPRGNVSLKICSKCRISVYCSEECQAEDWTRGHEKDCRKEFSPQLVVKSLGEVECPLQAQVSPSATHNQYNAGGYQSQRHSSYPYRGTHQQKFFNQQRIRSEMFQNQENSFQSGHNKESSYQQYNNYRKVHFSDAQTGVGSGAIPQTQTPISAPTPFAIPTSVLAASAAAKSREAAKKYQLKPFPLEAMQHAELKDVTDGPWKKGGIKEVPVEIPTFASEEEVIIEDVIEQEVIEEKKIIEKEVMKTEEIEKKKPVKVRSFYSTFGPEKSLADESKKKVVTDQGNQNSQVNPQWPIKLAREMPEVNFGDRVRQPETVNYGQESFSKPLSPKTVISSPPQLETIPETDLYVIPTSSPKKSLEQEANDQLEKDSTEKHFEGIVSTLPRYKLVVGKAYSLMPVHLEESVDRKRIFFYVAYRDFISKLMVEISKTADSSPKIELTSLEVGQVYLVKFDDEWFRGQVLRITPAAIFIDYFDFGNRKYVDRREATFGDYFRLLPPSLDTKRQPPMAIRLQVRNVPSFQQYNLLRRLIIEGVKNFTLMKLFIVEHCPETDCYTVQFDEV